MSYEIFGTNDEHEARQYRAAEVLHHASDEAASARKIIAEIEAMPFRMAVEVLGMGAQKVTVQTGHRDGLGIYSDVNLSDLEDYANKYGIVSLAGGSSATVGFSKGQLIPTLHEWVAARAAKLLGSTYPSCSERNRK